MVTEVGVVGVCIAVAYAEYKMRASVLVDRRYAQRCVVVVVLPVCVAYGASCLAHNSQLVILLLQERVAQTSGQPDVVQIRLCIVLFVVVVGKFQVTYYAQSSTCVEVQVYIVGVHPHSLVAQRTGCSTPDAHKQLFAWPYAALAKALPAPITSSIANKILLILVHVLR